MPKQWYIVHTYSGFEKKVKESLEAACGFRPYGQNRPNRHPDRIGRRSARRQKVISPRMCYPGYVLVEMDMDDYTWLWSAPRRASLVSWDPGRRLRRSRDEEVQNILNRATTTAEKPKPRLSFDRGEKVRIGEGPFANFTGIVEEVNTDRSTLKVSVTIFGRSTPVELDFAQVEKVA